MGRRGPILLHKNHRNKEGVYSQAMITVASVGAVSRERTVSGVGEWVEEMGCPDEHEQRRP